MRKGATFVGGFLVFLVVVSFAHMFIHLAVYEGSIGGIFSGGISGFAVDETPVDGKSSGFFGLQLSELILFMELSLIHI